MPKSVHTMIGSAFLGVLTVLSLIAFVTIPSLAAAAPQGPRAEKVLADEKRSPKVHFWTPKQIDYREGELSENSNPIAVQGANFVVNYNPANGCKTTGLRNFLPQVTPDPWPDGAKDAFEHGLGIWSMLLDASQTIVINACWVDYGNTDTLGTGQPVSVYADFTGAFSSTTMYPVALANELAGTDLNDNDGPDHDDDSNNSDAEIIIAFNGNNGIDWYFGIDANPPGSKKDFVTVALHEIAHGLGFVSTMDVDTGNDACGTDTPGHGCWGVLAGFQGMPVIYDRFLVDNMSNLRQKLISTTVFINPSSELGDEFTDNSVYFDGPSATAANGGALPRLYAPNTFDLGSSILHLNQSTYSSTPNRLMTPTAGEPIHHPGPVALGILEDIGWNIINLPPATFAKSTSVNTVRAGRALTYTLTVTNTGYLMMSDVTITDTVPANTTLNLDSLTSGDVTASGTAPGSLITWSTGVSLSTGNALSRTFAVTVSLGSSGSTITNTAFVRSSTGVGANDTASTTVVSHNNGVFLPIILSN